MVDTTNRPIRLYLVITIGIILSKKNEPDVLERAL
jgi:hypothetical protein